MSPERFVNSDVKKKFNGNMGAWGNPVYCLYGLFYFLADYFDIISYK